MAGRPELCRGLKGVSEDGRVRARAAGYRKGQWRDTDSSTKTVGHMLTKVRGTTEDGRGWVGTARAE